MLILKSTEQVRKTSAGKTTSAKNTQASIAPRNQTPSNQNNRNKQARGSASREDQLGDTRQATTHRPFQKIVSKVMIETEGGGEVHKPAKPGASVPGAEHPTKVTTRRSAALRGFNNTETNPSQPEDRKRALSEGAVLIRGQIAGVSPTRSRTHPVIVVVRR